MQARSDGFNLFFAQIQHEALCAVAEHWDDARGENRMPGWSHIDPTKIVKHLPIIWSWRYDRTTGIFTGRLSGEAITEAFGRSLRGFSMQDFFPADSYPVVYARHHKVVVDPCFSRDHGAVFRHVDRIGTGERIILPLADDGETGDGLIGATVYDMTQAVSGAPVQFAFDDLEFFPL